MPTLLLSPIFTEDSIALYGAALEAGWDVERLFGWRIPERVIGADVALYGEGLFAEFVAEALDLALLEPPFGWLTSVPAEHLRRTVRYLTLVEAVRVPGPAFFKPADEKCFPASVYPSGAAIPAVEGLPPETPVLVAEPVAWEVEYRCFVLDREVVAFSPYLRAGVLARSESGEWPASASELDEAAGYARTVLADRSMEVPPAFVLDVGVISGQGWAVVEANPAFAAGIYGCDPGAVLPVLRRATMRRERVTREEACWVIARAEPPGGGMT